MSPTLPNSQQLTYIGTKLIKCVISYPRITLKVSRAQMGYMRVQSTGGYCTTLA
jgi:hypothetical protein